MEHLSCDLLIVGGGGAGLRAAIAARESSPGCRVLLVTKGVLGKSGVTATACSDRMAFHATLPHTPPQDAEAWRYHADDIYRIGGFVSDQDLAEILARQSARAFDYLRDLGVPFAAADGVPLQFVTDGSEYPRACYTGPKTAVHMEEALLKRFRELNIPALKHCMSARLVTSAGRVTGALAVDTREREQGERALKVIQAKAVILATGGGGLIYRHNVFPAGMSGDGCALAYRAGAGLVNMEFIQIGIASVKTKFNCSGSMMRAVPRFVDDSGKEFLADYFPAGTDLNSIYDTVFHKGATWPLSFEHDTRIIDIAVYQKMREGRKVYLDYGCNPREFSFAGLPAGTQVKYRSEMTADLGLRARQAKPLHRLKEINPHSVAWLKERGIDLEKGDLVEVACCGQHFQGGVKIREQGQTTVPGLYAVGETAGGQHGANRPGGNALLDTQVFGLIAGEAAAAECLSLEMEPIPAAAVEDFLQELARLQHSAGAPAAAFRRRLRETVDSAAGVVRTEAGLTAGLVSLASLLKKGMRLGEKTFAYALENKNLALAAEAVLRAALLRDESRGPHLRFPADGSLEPLPRDDRRWTKYVVIRQKDGAMHLEARAPRSKEQEGRGKKET